MIDGFVESNTTENSTFPQYAHQNIFKSENPYLSRIFNKKSGLKTKNLSMDLYAFQFFNYERQDIIDEIPIKENRNIIKKVHN